MRLLEMISPRSFLPLLSGILLFLTTPLVGLESLIWIGFMPLFYFLALRETSPRQAFYGSTLAGFLYALGILYPLASLNAWWWVNFDSFIFEYRYALLLSFLFLLSLYSSIISFGIFGVLFNKAARQDFSSSRWYYTILFIFFFSVLWATVERVREFFVHGFTWGHVGYSLHENIFLLPLARYAEVYGLSAIIIAFNTLIVFALLPEMGQGISTSSHKKIRYGYIAGAVLFLLALHLLGYTLISNYEQGKEKLRVAVIHSGFTTEESAGIAGYERMMSLLKSALEENPDMVVLPENSFPFFVIEEGTLLPLKYENAALPIGGLYDQFLSLLSLYPDTSAVIGFHTEERGERYNSMIVFEEGAITDIYRKRELLPLAEQSPSSLREKHVEPLAKGGENQTVEALGETVVSLICSEIIFPKLSKREDAAFIINISNDSVFKSPAVGKQNHITAKVRAAAGQKYLLRSVKGGISSIIDPLGRVVVRSKESEESVMLVADMYY